MAQANGADARVRLSTGTVFAAAKKLGVRLELDVDLKSDDRLVGAAHREEV
jgi:hypothetical protein